MKAITVKYTLRTSNGFGDNKYDYEVLEAEVAASEEGDQGDSMMLEARRICAQNTTAALKRRAAAAAATAAAKQKEALDNG